MVVYQILELTLVAAALQITPLASLHPVRHLLLIGFVLIVPNDMHRRRLLKQGCPVMSLLILDSTSSVWIYQGVLQSFRTERSEDSLTKGRMNIWINCELTIKFDGCITDKLVLI